MCRLHIERTHLMVQSDHKRFQAGNFIGIGVMASGAVSAICRSFRMPMAVGEVLLRSWSGRLLRLQGIRRDDRTF